MDVTSISAARAVASDLVREGMRSILSGQQRQSPRPRGSGALCRCHAAEREAQMAVTFSAWGPFGPWVTSNSTRCASSSER